MEQNELKNIGKRVVVEQLKNKGWSQVNSGDNVPDPVDVLATQNGKSLLISITAAVSPNQPMPMTPGELEQLKALGQQNKADPYQVKLSLTQDMTGVERISWQKL
ncbi:MAG: hypothetical protein ACMUIG_07820 [Thermoplasmatota archaeon]